MSKMMICPKKECKYNHTDEVGRAHCYKHKKNSLCSKPYMLCPACVEVEEVSDAKQG
jgi:hypothetical protein